MIQTMKTSSRLKSLFSINKMMVIALLSSLFINSCNSDDEDGGPTPVASFTVSQNGSFVTFTNTSENSEENFWTFGDGSESQEVSPVNRYTESGEFEVFLLTVNGSNTDVASQVITVEVPDAPDASFTFEAVDREVTFTNTSPAGTVVEWDFGDGIGTSMEDNPVYTYTEDGTFTVTLTVVGAEGDEDTFSAFVEAIEAVPVAAFSTTIEDLEVTFANESVDADSFEWDFGDGSPVSTEENPVYTYTQEGTFTVTLTASNDNGNTDSISMDITVEDILLPPTADFTFVVTDFDVAFTDASVANDGNITAFTWDFGDGIGTSTMQNPTYTYATDGTFDVTLTITFDDIDGVTTATSTQTVTIIAGAVVVGAIIRDTDSGDTGELRYNIDPLLSGRLEVTFTRTLEAIDTNSGNGRDGFVALLNSTGSTSSQRSIMDLRVRADSFAVRDQDALDFGTTVPTPGTLQTAIVTWTAPDAETPPTVNLTIDGVMVATYTSGENSFGGVERVQFRFADNGSVVSPDSFFTIERFEVFTDVAGTTSLFNTDFSEFGIGEVLDGDGANDVFNNNSSEATVEVIE